MILPFTVKAVEEVGRWYQENEQALSRATRYQVMVRDMKTKEYLVGTLVTVLPPMEYCLNGDLQLVQVYPGTRPAFRGESTELV